MAGCQIKCLVLCGSLTGLQTLSHSWPSLSHFHGGHPLALIAAISRGLSQALIAAVSRGHPQARIAAIYRRNPWAFIAAISGGYLQALTATISGVPFSSTIRKVLSVSIPLRLQPATHLLSGSTPIVLEVVIPQTCTPLNHGLHSCHDSPPPKDCPR